MGCGIFLVVSTHGAGQSGAGLVHDGEALAEQGVRVPGMPRGPASPPVVVQSMFQWAVTVTGKPGVVPSGCC
ncbi:hypothetical protein C0Q99_19335 [Streptomyces albidoflavus]|nr:hypothetical protein C0Q99_19335 [Streptomyces albidoflavus]